MDRRETRDRACKKNPVDSGVEASSSSCGGILPSKFKVGKKANETVNSESGSVKLCGSVSSKTPVEKPVVLNKQVFVNCGVVSESSDNYSVMDGQSEYSESVMVRDSLSERVHAEPVGGEANRSRSEQDGHVPDETMFMRSFMNSFGRVMRDMESRPSA